MPPKKKEAEKAQSEVGFQQVEVSAKDPRTVVLLLESPEPAIVCRACEALRTHMEKAEQHVLEVQDWGTVPRLVRLLSSADKAIRTHTILCLSCMATKSPVRRTLCRSDCITPLLNLMQPTEELLCQERASFVTAELAVEYSGKVLLQRHGALEPLVQLLSSSDPDVQRNSVRAVNLLAESHHSWPALREAGGLPAVLELLGSEYALIQEHALKTLLACMREAGCRKVFCELDGLAKLVAFIGNKDYGDLHVMCVGVLALCLEEGVGMAALQSSNCLSTLLGHITSGSSVDMKRSAAPPSASIAAFCRKPQRRLVVGSGYEDRICTLELAQALAKAALNEVNQKILREQEVEKTFISLLSLEDAGACMAGCEGLIAMAKLSSSKQAIALGGGVEALVKVCGREEGSVRSVAVQAVAAVISEAPANCKVLCECGGVELVVGLLADGEALCRRFAADCIISMAPDDALRSELVAAGAVPALISSLNFPDSAVQESSAEAIGMLSCDSQARQQFSDSEGVSRLLLLLRSPHSTVQSSAARALSVLAQSREVAHAACQLGALELLEGLQGVRPASLALSKLLDSNLSAKYWMLGCLDPGDSLRDCEFFDVGQAQSSARPFVPLAILQQQPLTLSKPVVTVSLLAHSPPPPPPSEDPLPSTVDLSHSAVSVGSRSKSRNAPTRSKKSREREVESRVSEESAEQASPEKALPGLLTPDPALWSHITHTHSHILPLPSPTQQVQQLARYVSENMGGAVAQPGCIPIELPLGALQRDTGNPLVPIGKITTGTYQHRALLFKVLCDQLGINCSLVRGEYGRHWNQVRLMDGDKPRSFIVDLMSQPGRLLPAESPETAQYLHL